jgi:uncharacterized OB-fold protein
MLTTRKFPGKSGLADLVIPPTPDTQAYLDGLKSGELLVQRCAGCRKARYPFAPVCPYCHASKSDWTACSGQGTIVSWTRYPRSYLPEFEELVPYFVLCVQLDDGPRIFGRLAELDVTPTIDARVAAIIEEWADGGRAPAFVMSSVVSA